MYDDNYVSKYFKYKKKYLKIKYHLNKNENFKIKWIGGAMSDQPFFKDLLEPNPGEDIKIIEYFDEKVSSMFELYINSRTNLQQLISQSKEMQKILKESIPQGKQMNSTDLRKLDKLVKFEEASTKYLAIVEKREKVYDIYQSEIQKLEEQLAKDIPAIPVPLVKEKVLQKNKDYESYSEDGWLKTYFLLYHKNDPLTEDAIEWDNQPENNNYGDIIKYNIVRIFPKFRWQSTNLQKVGITPNIHSITFLSQILKMLESENKLMTKEGILLKTLIDEYLAFKKKHKLIAELRRKINKTRNSMDQL